MCVNGVNTKQLKDTIQQLDEAVALARRWTHRLYHLADDGGQGATAKALSEVQSLLDDARAALTDANDAVDEDDTKGVEVTRV